MVPSVSSGATSAGEDDSSEHGTVRGESVVVDRRYARRTPRRTTHKPQHRESAVMSEGGSQRADEFDGTFDLLLRRTTKNPCLSAQYRDLLNSSIDEVTDNSVNAATDILDSRIGASYWSAGEKEALLTRLQTCQPCDLHALQQAVVTKSESEVHVYLGLLQRALEGQESPRPAPDRFTYADIPAAAEISQNFDHHLDIAAEALADRVEWHDAALERRMFGDEWLISEELALDIDDRYDSQQSLQPDDEPSNDLELEDKDTDEQHVNDAMAGSTSTSAYYLLQLSTCLQLSRNIFMNSGSDQDLNWRQMSMSAPIRTISAEPAMFRSAVEDFSLLVTDFTRRLVYASLFQAQSRLRANDRRSSTAVASVRAVDVQTAASMLGLDASWTRFWATAAQRHSLGVFTESKKFDDGRPREHLGFRLTCDEVKDELGESNILPSTEDMEEIDEAEVLDTINDGDFCTDAYSDTSFEDARNESAIGEAKNLRSTRRKRGMSEVPLAHEDAYLDALDRRESVKEEQGLAELLQLDASDNANTDSRSPIRPQLLQTEQANQRWTTGTAFAAGWEQQNGEPDAAAFEAMLSRGQAGNKRRRLFNDMVRERLAQGKRSPTAVREDETQSEDESSSSRDSGYLVSD